MTSTFTLIIIGFFLFHCAITFLILQKLDNDKEIFTNILLSVIWSVFIVIVAEGLFVHKIKEEHTYDGDILYSAPLIPFQSSNGDSVYLEIDCQTYHAYTSEDSSIWANGAHCSTFSPENGSSPYYEKISTKTDAWVLKLLTPDHEILQPQYRFYVPDSCTWRKPCEDESPDLWFCAPDLI